MQSRHIGLGLLLCLTVAAAACSGGGGASEGAAGSWEARLALLPFVDPAEGSVQVSMGDLATAAELADVPWPAADADPLDSLVRLAGVGGSPVAVPFPSFVQSIGGDGVMEELRATAGWGLEDLDWLATATVPPVETTVGGGRIDADAMADALGSDGPPWRLGDGDDLEPSLESPNPLDPLGRSITLTVVDGTLGFSTVSEGLDALEGEGRSMAEVEQVRRLVALADEEGCYALTIYASEEAAQLTCNLAEVAEGPQFLLAATGVDDPAAEVARISEIDTAGRADSVTVLADGDLVRVEIDATDEVPGRFAADLLLRLDPLVPGFGG